MTPENPKYVLHMKVSENNMNNEGHPPITHFGVTAILGSPRMFVLLVWPFGHEIACRHFMLSHLGAQFAPQGLSLGEGR